MDLVDHSAQGFGEARATAANGRENSSTRGAVAGNDDSAPVGSASIFRPSSTRSISMVPVYPSRLEGSYAPDTKIDLMADGRFFGRPREKPTFITPHDGSVWSADFNAELKAAKGAPFPNFVKPKYEPETGRLIPPPTPARNPRDRPAQSPGRYSLTGTIRKFWGSFATMLCAKPSFAEPRAPPGPSTTVVSFK